MINYGKQHSNNEPQPITITSTKVLVANNVIPYTLETDNHIINGYEYDYIEYDKDEYILKIIQDNEQMQQNLIDTQMALCDLYESLEGESDLNG